MDQVMTERNDDMKKCIFTICAKNYLGLAYLMGSSVRKHEPETDFLIVVADEFECGRPEGTEGNVIVAREVLGIDEWLWLDMAFKYNLTEFCTSIKPFCVEYFFREGYDKVCYLDPDTYLFSSFSQIWEKLDSFLVVTAPHLALPAYPYEGDLPDRSFLFNGISNLGFGAFRKSDKTLNLMRWWQDRLKTQCFGEMIRAQCTDQKWTDFFQAFLEPDELLVSGNLGLNLAPWNYHEREVSCVDGTYYVTSRAGISPRRDQLVLFHFAGYNYRQFAVSGLVDNEARMRISNLRQYSDIEPLVAQYAATVHASRETIESFLNLPYTYGSFDNGDRIDKMHRRLYNGMVEYFGEKGNPFRTGKGTFHARLRKAGMIDKSTRVDSLNETNIPSYDRKLRVLYALLRVFYRIVGYRNYVLLLQFARRISLFDMNTFLLGKEFENKGLR